MLIQRGTLGWPVQSSGESDDSKSSVWAFVESFWSDSAQSKRGVAWQGLSLALQSQATSAAFAAVLADGFLVTPGATPILEFDGSVGTWGHPNFGGDCSQLRVQQIQAKLRLPLWSLHAAPRACFRQERSLADPAPPLSSAPLRPLPRCSPWHLRLTIQGDALAEMGRLGFEPPQDLDGW